MRLDNLRKLTMRLEIDGTISRVSKPFKLYKDSFGFILLQCYVAKSQNATKAPLCTVSGSTINIQGQRTPTTERYNLVYVGEADIDGAAYRLFETPMPKAFTDTEGELKIVFNYADTRLLFKTVQVPIYDNDGNVIGQQNIQEPVLDENGVQKRELLNRLTSNEYSTQVSAGGWNNEPIELDITSTESAQINDNKIAIGGLQLQIDTLSQEITNLDITARPATRLELGVVKVGARLNIDTEGLLSAQKQVEFGKDEPSQDLMIGGIFFKEMN